MARVIVLHAGYGCDTGCCGHVVEVDGERVGQFDFSHPPYRRTPDELREWIRDLVTEQAGAEHVADIDFDNCVVSDD